MCQREVHIVAAEDQVIADADTADGRLAVSVAGWADLHQAEIRGAAADVAHQQQPRIGQVLRQGGALAIQPVVEGSLRFLQQAQRGQARHARRLQRQRARAFVKGSGNS